MGNRQFDQNSKSYVKGAVYLDFSFMTNGAANPTITYKADGTLARGAGPFTVTRTGVGLYILTIDTPFRWVIAATADIDETVSPGDGAFSTKGPAANEGTSLPLVIPLYLRNAAGALADFTGRRVCYQACLKNSLAGT